MLNHSSRASWKVFPNKKHPEGLLPVSPASSCPSHLLLATYHSPLGGKPILSVAALPVMAKGGPPLRAMRPPMSLWAPKRAPAANSVDPPLRFVPWPFIDSSDYSKDVGYPKTPSLGSPQKYHFSASLQIASGQLVYLP